VKEFDTIYDKLYDQIPTDPSPPLSFVYVIYMNAFEGKFGFILKDKAPDTLAKAKEYSA
jgi:hypothetical protein